MVYYHKPFIPSSPEVPPETLIESQGLIPVPYTGSSGARRMAARTVKNDQVRILGHIFQPSDLVYASDGRLDGYRYMFWLYPKITYNGYVWYLPSVFMSSSEHYYKVHKYCFADDVAYVTAPYTLGPWAWWRVVDHDTHK
jgi:hypothetical protein